MRDIYPVWREQIAEAQSRYRVMRSNRLIYRLHLYCDSSDCSVREIDILVKEHGPQEAIPAALPCPACGVQLKYHGADLR